MVQIYPTKVVKTIECHTQEDKFLSQDLKRVRTGAFKNL